MLTARSRLCVAALLAFAACDRGPADPATARVFFVLDAPLCSSVLPVEFRIDNVTVGLDTFRVNYGPSRIKSRGFAVEPGARTLGARVTGGYVWTDTTVQLDAGMIFTDTLPFYCS